MHVYELSKVCIVARLNSTLMSVHCPSVPVDSYGWCLTPTLTFNSDVKFHLQWPQLAPTPSSWAGSEELAKAPVCSCLSARLSFQLWPPPTDAAPCECSADLLESPDTPRSSGEEDASRVAACRSSSCTSLFALAQFDQANDRVRDSWELVIC